MSGHSKLSRTRSMQILSAVSVLCCFVDAQAMTISPSPSTTGNYTIAWNAGCFYTGQVYPYPDIVCTYLVENGTVVSSFSPFAVTGKSAGTYYYEVVEDWWWYQTPVDSGSVIVGTPPPRDPIPTQLTYQYQTRQGDINGDGRTDLFVKRTSGGSSGNGVLESVILTQQPAGSSFLQALFGSTFSAWAPDSYYSGIASSWPLSTATVVVTDFNVDGYVDVEVKGVTPATGGAVYNDQIIYSSAALFQPQPLGLRAVDASLKQFVANSLDYFVNRDYFWENVTTAYFADTYYYFACQWMPGNYGVLEGYTWANWGCPIYASWITGYYYDYSGFSQEALAIWSWEESFVATSNATASTTGAQGAAEEVLGVPIGGWVMEEVFGSTGDHTDPDMRRGLETFWAILGIGRANAQEIETEEAPPQDEWGYGCICVRARMVSGFYLARHASLGYVSGFPGQIGAYDSVPDALLDGLLISSTNDPTDHPTFTMKVRVVNKPNGMPCDFATDQLYWQQLLSAEANYDNLLPYNKFGGPPGYNSNGFVHGILNATGGSIDNAESADLVGWSNAVPVSAFQ